MCVHLTCGVAPHSLQETRDTPPQTSALVGVPRTPEGSPPTTEEEESTQFVTSTTGQSSTSKELFRNQVDCICPIHLLNLCPVLWWETHCVFPLFWYVCVFVDIKGGPSMSEQAPQAWLQVWPYPQHSRLQTPGQEGTHHGTGIKTSHFVQCLHPITPCGGVRN